MNGRIFCNSLRGRLLALVFIALIPPFALLLHNTAEETRRATEDAQKTAFQLARLAAQSHEQVIADARTLLTLISRLPLILDPPACNRVFTDFTQFYPNLANLAVITPEGRVTCTSAPMLRRSNFADRRWFKDVLHSRKFTASDYLIGKATKRPTVVFASPVFNAAQKITAVVSVSVQMSWLNHFTQQAQLPEGSTLTVFDKNGTMLGRYPDPEKWVGKSVTGWQSLKTQLGNRQERAIETGDIDGVRQLYAFRPLGTHDDVEVWYLAIGIPKATAFAHARTALKRNVAWMIIVTLLTLYVAWLGSDTLILRRIRLIVDASRKLGTGDFNVRTGMSHDHDEIGQLAGAFDQMAHALKEREAERQNAAHTRAQLAALVESSTDAIIGRDLDGRVTSWNKSAEVLFGYSSDEMIGHSSEILIPADQSEKVNRNAERIKAGERIPSYETVRLKKGGDPVNVSISISPVVDGNGKISGASSIIRDITERNRAEQELKKQNEILQTIFDHIPVMINFIDGAGRIKLVNREWERTVGWTLEEIESQELDIFSLCYPDPNDRQRAMNAVAAAKVEWLDLTTTTRDGRLIDTTWAITKLSDETCIGIGMDITKRKRAERQIRALHEINLAMTSTLELPMILKMLLEKVDVFLPYAASHIRLLDPATGKMDAVTAHNMDETQWKAHSHPLHHAVHTLIVQSKRPLTIRNIQEDSRTGRKDFYREQGLVSYLGVPLIVKQNVIGALSLLTREEHDFTQEEIEFAETLAKQASVAIHNSQLYTGSKRLSEERETAEKQIRGLANGLMHARDEEAKRIASVLHDESGQLLAAVYIGLDELAKALPASMEAVDEIKGVLDRVEQRLRDLSHELHPTMLDHLGLVPGLKFLAQQIAKRTGIGINIEAELNGRLSALLELTLYRVIQEALNNAARHSQARKVRIKLLEDETLIQCSIEDDGAGFNPKELTRSRQRKITGLGLAGIRERVDALNGTYQILSAPGDGTKLYITLPLTKEKPDVAPRIAC